MESIYHAIVTLTKKLRRRFLPNVLIYMNMNLKYCYKFGIITNTKLLQCFLKAMAEKIERMELDADSKDKVYYVLSNSV